MKLRRIGAALAVIALTAVGGGCSDDSPGASSETGGDTIETSGDASESTSTGADETTSVDRAAIAQAVVVEVIRPAYGLLSTTSADLARTVSDACAVTSVDLAASRDAWRAARSAWHATRSIRFGPVMELRAASSIDFPVDPTKVAALVAGAAPLDAGALADLGADQRGLSGIELVLFGEAAPDARGCDYLIGASALVAERAAEINNAWAIDTSAADDTKMFIDDTVNGIVFALTDVSAQRLGPAAGMTTETAEFAEVDAGLARSAVDDAVAATKGASAVADVIDPLVRGQSADTADRARDQLAAALTSISAIPGSISETADTAPLTAAYESTRAALVTIRTEVASLLGVTLTLGDADGDS